MTSFRRFLNWAKTGGYYSSVYGSALMFVIGLADIAMGNVAGGLAFLAFSLLLLEVRRRTINRARRRSGVE